MMFIKTLSVVLLFLSNNIIPVTSQNIGRFWHVTDFHYDTTYMKAMLSCNGPVAEPGPYGDYWCDSPWSLVTSAISFMGEQQPDVDFVIWTGDTVAHISDSDTSLEENMDILHNVTTALEEALPGIPVYASLGNHDFYPSDQAPGDTSELYRLVGEMWKEWIGSYSQVQRFEDGGFYSAVLGSGKIRVLALNTNLYYTSNDLTEHVDDPAGQFEWMEDQLMEAKDAGQKVILTGHIPPGLLTPGLEEWFYPGHKERFMQVLLDHHDVVAATHFGHDHSDGFKVLQSDDRSKAVTQFTAPSITPWRYRFSTATGEQIGDPHNPGVRLVEYDRDTGAHLTYHQYYINLTISNTENATNWSKLYTFTDSYDLTDMSVSSLRGFFERLQDGGGSEYTTLYCNHAVVSKLDKPCSDKYRGDIYCGGIYYDLDKAENCVEEYLKAINRARGNNVANLTLISLVTLGYMLFAH